MKEIITTEFSARAIGPYSQAVKANGFIFVSGQIAIDAVTTISPHDPELQRL